MEVKMNRYLFLWLIITVLLTTAGCPPRYPPQPISMKGASSGFASDVGIDVPRSPGQRHELPIGTFLESHREPGNINRSL
jgi:hypothetical protein